MPDRTRALTLQLLAWIARRPRSYAETMDAWRSTCPRLTVWEDALADGLVDIRGHCGGGTSEQAGVMLTPRGRALLLEGQAHSTDIT